MRFTFLTFKCENIKVFLCHGEHVRTYISGSRCEWWQKTTNEQTHTRTHTHTRDNYSNPRCAHARRGLIKHSDLYQEWCQSSYNGLGSYTKKTQTNICDYFLSVLCGYHPVQLSPSTLPSSFVPPVYAYCTGHTDR